MKNRKTYVYLALLSLFFLIILSITAISLIYAINNQNEVPSIPADEIYIYITDSESLPAETSDYYRLVKEHNGQIGIFDSNGKLLETIDTYIKTLPKTDIDRLREGINVRSEGELYLIIEAYSD